MNLFDAQPETWISGEEIAASLSVSRAAIWKAVSQLRDDGYPIEALPRKGYKLAVKRDMLSALGILKYLDSENQWLDIQVLREVRSTNLLLREKAIAGCPEGTVLIAGMQTEGRGRMGRRFFSPSNTGIYMSLLLRPVQISAEIGLRLTTMAAIAACDAIEEVSGNSAMIKWVNDLYMQNRKVGGILTEGTVSVETGQMESVVLGIGLNVYAPDGGFPRELQNIAGAVFSETQNNGKNRLAAAFLNRFFRLYRSGDFLSYTSEYRRRSIAVGRLISVLSSAGMRSAYAVDVDPECRLVVRYEDGTEEHLSSGEISIKL